MPSFTWRMPADVRSQLEAAAKKSGLNLSDELLRRLRASFSMEHERRRDPATKALTFLISTAAQWISLSPTRPNWHRNRFLYQAFQIAALKILAAFEPPGEIVQPHKELISSTERTPGEGRLAAMMREDFKTPENAADFAVGIVLRQYFLDLTDDLQQWHKEESPPPEVTDFLSRITYNMSNARHDLGIKLEDLGIEESREDKS